MHDILQLIGIGTSAFLAVPGGLLGIMPQIRDGPGLSAKTRISTRDLRTSAVFYRCSMSVAPSRGQERAGLRAGHCFSLVLWLLRFREFPKFLCRVVLDKPHPRRHDSE